MADNINDVLNQFSNSEFGEVLFERLDSIEDILKRIGGMSQTNASSASHNFRDEYDEIRSNRRTNNRTRTGRNAFGRKNGSFMDEFEHQILEGLVGADIGKDFEDMFKSIADIMGTDLENLTGEFGKKLGEISMSAFKNTNFGGKLSQNLTNLREAVFTKGQSALKDATTAFAAGDISGTIASLGGGLKALLPELMALGPQVAIIAAAFVVLSPLLDSVVDLFGSLANLGKVLISTGNRYEQSRKKMLENEQKRIREDVETLVTYPFEILKQSAQEVEKAWDSAIKVINATQGYDKSGLQDLMSSFAQRLRDEGLSSVVSGTDIITNLTKVLESGLSGKIAEEFAYQATVLNEAIPTQDFFSYASSYASLAANAIASGKSQSEAISMANSQLNEFANNLLYASRQLSGGFSTGLQNASSLFEQSVKIATAAGSTNYEQISSVLLGVAGRVGSVAPDLVYNMTDIIYRATTGGNPSELTALRSLAGTGASNTEFLRAFVKNPQQIFSNIFTKLADIYTDSNDAFMERAEALASTFGVSFEAFQRIDFRQLADAIRSMDLSNKNLSENMSLLQGGQTKTTEEQLKASQINKYMIEEGLSYVLDNAAARSIQEHMWNEQIANEIMEATYAVDLSSATMKVFEDISALIRMIVRIINPISWLNGVANVAETMSEIREQRKDIQQVLELGKVGSGNQKELQTLLTTGVKHDLIASLPELMGGVSNYRYGLSKFTQIFGNNGWSIGKDRFSIFNNDVSNLVGPAGYGIASQVQSSDIKPPTSRYNYGSSGGFSISKSAFSALAKAVESTTNLPQHSIKDSISNAVSATANVVSNRLSEMLDQSYILDEYVKQGKSFEDWKNSGSRFGITDTSSALAAAGYDEDELRRYYGELSASEGGRILSNQYEDEKDFRDKGREFWGVYFPDEYNDLLDTNLTTIIQNQESWQTYFTEQWVGTVWNSEFVGQDGLFKKFFDEFVNYFVKHEYYNSYYDFEDVKRIQNMESEQSEDANFALAEALTKNINDLTDPTMQTNALLAQILIIVSAIQNQNNSIGTISLPDTLSALAMGLQDSTTNAIATGTGTA